MLSTKTSASVRFDGAAATTYTWKSFYRPVNYTIEGSIRGALKGTVNGFIDGKVDGTIAGSVDSTVVAAMDGTIAPREDEVEDHAHFGDFNGAISGTVNGTVHMTTVDGDSFIGGGFAGTVVGTVGVFVCGTFDGTIDGYFDGTMDGTIDGDVEGTKYVDPDTYEKETALERRADGTSHVLEEHVHVGWDGPDGGDRVLLLKEMYSR